MEHLHLFTPVIEFDTSKLNDGDSLFCVINNTYATELLWTGGRFYENNHVFL